MGAGLLWTVYALFTGDHNQVSHQLNESLSSTAQIVFFLMGAMTIVEVVDAHQGFEVITSRIRTTKLYCKRSKIAVFVGAKQGSSALPAFDLRGSKGEAR